MLIFTNRALDSKKNDQSALTRRYEPFSPTLNYAHAASEVQHPKTWQVTDQKIDAPDADVMAAMLKCFHGAKPVLVFLHGNNTPPEACFTRCQWLEDQYNVTVIGYSWASEGYQPDGSDLGGIDLTDLESDQTDESLASVSRNNLKEGWIQRKARRYAQAKINAQHSTKSLARFLRLLAAARLTSVAQPFSFVSHSLGGHFLHYAIEQEAAAESFSMAHNVVFMAACTGAAKHPAWIGRLNPLMRVYVSFNGVDNVLAAATVIDGDLKLGTNPGTERLVLPKFRYIDFKNGGHMKFGAHRYFVADPGEKLSKQAEKLFGNIFTSKEDFRSKDDMKSVYPVGCSGDGSVCYMGSTQPESDS